MCVPRLLAEWGDPNGIRWRIVLEAMAEDIGEFEWELERLGEDAMCQPAWRRTSMEDNDELYNALLSLVQQLALGQIVITESSFPKRG
jgi:hypothetical protein